MKDLSLIENYSTIPEILNLPLHDIGIVARENHYKFMFNNKLKEGNNYRQYAILFKDDKLEIYPYKHEVVTRLPNNFYNFSERMGLTALGMQELYDFTENRRKYPEFLPILLTPYGLWPRDSKELKDKL